ncbi:hypothetical protein ACQ4PT_047754 [Festuca glaucescens]
MANYDCDPFPHIPAGMVIVPPGPLHTQRGHVVIGGNFPAFYDDWAIATLAPAMSQNHHEIISETIAAQLQNYGLEVRTISKCAMGSALVRFATVIDRDAAVNLSPMWIGDTSLRFVPQDHAINRRATLLTHDVWLMIMNYPLECWDVEIIMRTFVPFGRFLVWNKDMSDRARILVKIRAYNVDTLPLSLVVIRNLTDDGNADSWTCPLYLISRVMLGGGAGDEDPLPPNGGNPHHVMIYGQGGFWHDQAMHNDDEMEQGHDDPVFPNQAAPANAAPAAPMEQMDPITPEVFDTSVVQETAHDIPHHDAARDPLQILRNLITSINGNATESLSKLDGIAFAGAKCSIIDNEGPTYTTRQCIIMVDTILPKTNSSGSTVQIEEIPEENNEAIMVPAAPTRAKKQKKGPLVGTEVRRSSHLAGIAAGYKDKESALAADKDERTSDNTATNLTPRFEAVIRDHEAAAPPHLPLSTIQAIGVGHCKIPPTAVSEANLMYDSANDSV